MPLVQRDPSWTRRGASNEPTPGFWIEWEVKYFEGYGVDFALPGGLIGRLTPAGSRSQRIGKFTKKHPQLRELQHVQKWSNRETKKVVWPQNCSHGLENFWDPNFKIQMFSNDIFNEKIVTISVTLKTVKNLNLNFKFFWNWNFRSWAFRNYAYFVMKPSGCDTVRLSV